MTRFVFDTNVTVSALLFNESVPGRAFFRALGHGKYVVIPVMTMSWSWRSVVMQHT